MKTISILFLDFHTVREGDESNANNDSINNYKLVLKLLDEDYSRTGCNWNIFPLVELTGINF